MIVALYQCPEPRGVEAGLRVVDAALAKAAGANVDLLVMPETFLPGYAQVGATDHAGFAGIAPRLAALCRTHGVALVIGVAHVVDDGLTNTALALAADGAECARYTKIQLFGAEENALYTPGNDYVTFDYNGTRFGLLICYDIEFPEHARALARLGAEVILVPTANMAPFTNVNQFMVPARAAENAVTIVYANYCGRVPGHSYCGMSLVAGPDGHALAQMAHGEGLCLAELPTAGWSEHDIPLATQIRDFKPV